MRSQRGSERGAERGVKYPREPSTYDLPCRSVGLKGNAGSATLEAIGSLSHPSVAARIFFHVCPPRRLIRVAPLTFRIMGPACAGLRAPSLHQERVRGDPVAPDRSPKTTDCSHRSAQAAVHGTLFAAAAFLTRRSVGLKGNEVPATLEAHDRSYAPSGQPWSSIWHPSTGILGEPAQHGTTVGEN